MTLSTAELLSTNNKKLVGVQGIPLQLVGAMQIDIELCSEEFQADVIVADSLPIDVILGRDFLKAQQCTIEMTPTRDVLHFKER